MASRCRPCVLCRQPARHGRACDACRERVRTAPPTPAQRRPQPTQRAPRPPCGAVPTEPLAQALRRSGDPVELVAARLDIEPRVLERKLAQSWVGPEWALRLARALHVAPVDLGL